VSPDQRPWRIVVMGVTGVGKSTVGARLAEVLGVPFVDADDLHDARSIEKMRASTPLDDADRIPWWERINGVLRAHAAEGVVIAASALTPAARAAMTVGVDDVRFVLLRADPRTIATRINDRVGHFAGASLLPSQLALLDPPADAVVLDAQRSPDELVAAALTALRRR